MTAVHTLLRRCLARFDEACGKLTRTQFEVLSAVHAEPGATAHRLAEITGIDRSTMSDVVMRLERGGLMERTRSTADTRMWRTTLTALGRTEMERAKRESARAHAKILKSLKPTERKSLAEYLSKIGESHG